MPAAQYIIIDHTFKDEILAAINELKLLIMFKNEKSQPSDNICWMDNADLMQYLHISRRTTLTLRRRGLPFSQVEGKIFYRKDLVDKFLDDHQINLNGK
jgi:hypothetical protein